MTEEYKTTIPFTKSSAVTPADGTDLPNVARSLYITVGGTIKFVTVGGDTDTWTVPDNFYLLGQIKRVWATGTTATGIHALI